MHGVLGGQVVEDLLGDLLLALGEGEGQLGVEGVEQAVRPRACAPRRAAAVGGRRRASATWRTNASSHFRRSRASAMSALVCGRWIFAAPRGAGEAAARAQRRRAAGRGLQGAGQHGVDGLGDLPGLQLLAGRVDRDELARRTRRRPRRRRPVSSSYSGWASCSLRLKTETLPANIARRAGQQLLCGLWTPLPKKTSGAGRCRR